MPDLSKMSQVFALLFSLVIVFLVFSATLLLIDTTIEGIGFSPFNIWSPLQTSLYAIGGFLVIIALVILESPERKIKLLGFIHIPILMLLTIFTVFSVDPSQILQHWPLLELFFYSGFAGVFLYGGLLGVYIAYLHSMRNYERTSWDETISELIFRGIVVLVIAPMFLIMVFIAIIYLLLSFTPPLFPFYGEGTGGSVLAVGAILSMYFGARLVSRYGISVRSNHEKRRAIDVVRPFIEGLAAFLCTVGAFSIIGGLLTDGIPPPLLISPNMIVLSSLVAFPFSFFLARHEILAQHEEIPSEEDTVEELGL